MHILLMAAAMLSAQSSASGTATATAPQLAEARKLPSAITPAAWRTSIPAEHRVLLNCLQPSAPDGFVMKMANRCSFKLRVAATGGGVTAASCRRADFYTLNFVLNPDQQIRLEGSEEAPGPFCFFRIDAIAPA